MSLNSCRPRPRPRRREGAIELRTRVSNLLSRWAASCDVRKNNAKDSGNYYYKRVVVSFTSFLLSLILLEIVVWKSTS